MPYGIVEYNDADRKTFLDGCQAMGVKVLFPMQLYGEHGTGERRAKVWIPTIILWLTLYVATPGLARNWSKAGSYQQHFNGSAAATAWQKQAVKVVEMWRRHPALLGWYIW